MVRAKSWAPNHAKAKRLSRQRRAEEDVRLTAEAALDLDQRRQRTLRNCIAILKRRGASAVRLAPLRRQLEAG